MTKTLLIRLEAPVQTWNNTAGTKERVSNTHPTKSGVIGLLANACGRNFDDDISDLAALHYAVRADRLGHFEPDYHTAGGGHYPALPSDWIRGIGKDKNSTTWRQQTINRPLKNINPDKPVPLAGTIPPGIAANTKQITEIFLVEASFTAALTGEDHFIKHLGNALRAPARALFLGKKANPPSSPLYIGITDDNCPVAALKANPPQSNLYPGPWTIWATTTPNDPDGYVIYDQPQAFDHFTMRNPRVEKSITQTETQRLSDFF